MKDILIAIGYILFSVILIIIGLAISVGLPILCIFGLLKYLGVL